MNDREFFQARRQAEKDVFLRVIRAMPAGRLDYKPHERSPSAADLLATLVSEHGICGDLVMNGRCEYKVDPVAGVEEAAKAFERHWDDLDGKVAALDDAGWTRNGQFFAGGKMMLEQPIGEFLWFILFDAIHHRGQLSTYIRPMGGQVPSIYGPSGDSRR
ncbi:MAG TPA: DinB family protein [Vicinamibacteria bacterium]|jgi:uncharacterized damage-inducible protein DinB